MTINPGKAALFALLLFVGSYGAGYFAPHPTKIDENKREAPSPFPTPSDQLEDSVTVTALSIIEDSRCPMNARCIQAGTVRISAQVTFGALQATTELKLGEPKEVLGKTITLTDVTPLKMVGEQYDFSEYSFTFEVK